MHVTDDEMEEFSETKPASKGRKKLIFRMLIVIGVLLIALFIFRWQVERHGGVNLTEVEKVIDNAERRWRVEDIEADRLTRSPPPEQDASKLVLEIARQIPEAWNEWRKNSKCWEPSHDNHLPVTERIRELRLHQETTSETRNLALALRYRRSGRYTFLWPDNPLALSLPHLDSAGCVVALLEYDARLAALDRDPNRGIRAAHAALNVARSIGDEPTLVSQNFRMMFQSRAAITTLGILASGVPTDGLKELQVAFLEEADEPVFLNGIRGERAAYHRMFEGLAAGRLQMGKLFPTHGEVGTSLAFPAVFEAYRPLLAGDHAECIRLYTACTGVARLPWHEQREAIKNIATEKENLSKPRYPLTRMTFPLVENFVEKNLRNRSQLLITATAIACEQFRQQHGRWPRELSEIPKEILSSIPLSPFDGQPIQYRMLPDRVTLCCYSWAKDQMNGHDAEFREQKAGPIEFRSPEALGFGIGACVWNPDRRGLAFQEAGHAKEIP